MATATDFSADTPAYIQFSQLESWLASADALQLPLHQIESQQQAKGREVQRLLLQAHLQHRGNGDVGHVLQLRQADGAVRYSHRRLGTRSLTTVFGAVELVHMGYSRPGGPSIFPLDKPKPTKPARKEKPRLRRLIANDATFEAPHEIMADNPAGILVIRDELTGWWSQLDRAGREGERAFCLQAWNGNTGHTVDRIGRGSIYVEACCMSMLGGIQPARLSAYLVDAVRGGPNDDGLIQRFQLMVWPDTPPKWKYVDHLPDAVAEEKSTLIFGRLVELNSENPVRHKFAPEAQTLFVEWLEKLETKLREGDLHPAMVSHLSKYRSLMPSLALLFHLADRASSVGFEGSYLDVKEKSIEVEQAERAVAWCDYLESHALRVYQCVQSPQLIAAQELARRIKNGSIGKDGVFSGRTVYLKGWSGLGSSETVRRACEVLQDAAWIRELPFESGPNGGRPSSRYEVNPAVWL